MIYGPKILIKQEFEEAIHSQSQDRFSKPTIESDPTKLTRYSAIAQDGVANQERNNKYISTVTASRCWLSPHPIQPTDSNMVVAETPTERKSGARSILWNIAVPRALSHRNGLFTEDWNATQATAMEDGR
jgi:hypothetical protein